MAYIEKRLPIPVPKEESGAEEEVRKNPQLTTERVGRGFGADVTKPSADEAEFMASKVTPNPVSVSSEKTINYEGNKPKIVTKEQLAAFQKENGADKTLRDYMNAQQGLKRRTNKYEDQGYDASGKLPAPLRSIPQLPNIKFAKGGITSKYMSFTKTGKPDGMKPVMAKGGVTRSSASKRADGCATKGFTKGKNL